VILRRTISSSNVTLGTTEAIMLAQGFYERGARRVGTRCANLATRKTYLLSFSIFSFVKSPMERRLSIAQQLIVVCQGVYMMGRHAVTGNMRANGVRSLDVSCWLSRMVFTRCGIIGADARPNWKEQAARESHRRAVILTQARPSDS
jgi:hypothetical protein